MKMNFRQNSIIVGSIKAEEEMALGRVDLAQFHWIFNLRILEAAKIVNQMKLMRIWQQIRNRINRIGLF
jgi:hypothetical protein